MSTLAIIAIIVGSVLVYFVVQSAVYVVLRAKAGPEPDTAGPWHDTKVNDLAYAILWPILCVSMIAVLTVIAIPAAAWHLGRWLMVRSLKWRDERYMPRARVIKRAAKDGD